MAALEKRLMAALLAEYQWAFRGSPQSDLVSLFTLIHLSQSKGLSKTQGDRAQLGHLLIPIGPYSLDVLEHLVATFSAGIVQPLWRKKWLQPGGIQDYQDLRVLEIGMDLAYFKHLRYPGDSLESSDFEAVDRRDH